ncbi:hypothetical protein CHS0354_038893 [Potamilus streckersoni]|uniref:Uncharacterized protein n=1 Tax=Potamilus streckersoni TaxID=2493646 RepID=A0AAE0T1T4_9BIVA|nr:hypothetical protein CHS0354_038893 [Potamilus streckersoni]
MSLHNTQESKPYKYNLIPSAQIVGNTSPLVAEVMRLRYFTPWKVQSDYKIDWSNGAPCLLIIYILPIEDTSPS